MKEGKVMIPCKAFIGFKNVDGKIEVDDEEAEVVRRIYTMFLRYGMTSKSIADTLKDVLYSDVTNRELLMSLERNGIQGEKNYLVAMISSAVLRSVKKGCLTDVMKLIETLEGTAPEKLEITNMDKTVAELQEYISKKRSDDTDDNQE